MNPYRRVLVALVGLCLLVGGVPVLAARLRAEAADRVVTLAVDYGDMVNLAAAHGEAPATVIRAMRAAGVDALGVPEDTLASLQDQGRLTVRSGGQVLDQARLGRKPPLPATEVDPLATYVYGMQTPALAAWLLQALTDRFGRAAVRQPAPGVVAVTGSFGLVESTGLGYRPGELAGLRRLGLEIVLRPGNGPGMTAAAVRRYFDAAAAETPLHLVIFSGLEAMGYPHALGAVVNAFRSHRLVLGAIETPVQLGNIDQMGIRAINRGIGQRTVRVYSVPPWVQDTPPANVVTNIVSAVESRHIRVVYLHPLTRLPDPTQEVRTDAATFGSAAAALRADGYAIGPVRPMPPVSVSRWERIVLTLGAVAAGLLLLSLIWPVTGWAWLIVCGLAGMLVSAVSATLAPEAAALLAAVSLAGLGVFVVGRAWRQPPGNAWLGAVLTALAAAAVALVGALYVASLLGDTTHMLEWSYFRGVKATYFGPPLLAVVAFVLYTGEGRGFEASLQRFLNEPISLKHLLVGLVVLGGGALYLLRSGNVAGVLPGESHLRAFLQHVLVYRPREKEFLVGYPALFLAVLFAYRRSTGWFLVFLVGSSAALVSLVDSFEHIRAPVLTSLLRSANGLALGLVTGSVALCAVSALIGWWQRRHGTS